MEKELSYGNIDRFLFPDFKDLIWVLDNYFPDGKEKFEIAKVFEFPFQIGMVLAMLPEIISPEDEIILKCFKAGISSREKWVRRREVIIVI